MSSIGGLWDRHESEALRKKVVTQTTNVTRQERIASVLISIGWIRWKMSLIWSDNWKRWQWSNIRLNGITFSKETGDKHWTTNCLLVKTSVSYLFTRWFHLIEIGKKIRACGHDFEEVMHAYDNLRIRWKMSLIWSDNWKRWQSNFRPDGIILWKETGDTHWTKKKPIENREGLNIRVTTL